MEVDLEGLSHGEAVKRYRKHGPNTLPEKPLPGVFVILLQQLKSPLVYILLFAAIVTFFLGHFADTLIILLAVFVNTVLGFVQEQRANKSLYALKKMVQPRAFVIRDGVKSQIPSEEVVPGDICILNQGDKIPADGEIIKENRLYINESLLTGESVSVNKKVGDVVFMGTIVSSGQTVIEVKTTGALTQMGKIALEVQLPDEDTPLTKQLKIFSNQLTVLVALLTIFVFVMGLLTGKGLVEIFKTSVALAVSSIPEGLLVGLTVVLAIGMQRILKRKGLVRNLVSAETLGGVTTICVDKTGTLTQGKMQVTEFVGNVQDLALQATVANDLDDPMLIAAHEWAHQFTYSQSKSSERDVLQQTIDSRYKRLDSIPFSSRERYFVSLNKFSSKENIIFLNGAPEILLEHCILSESEKREISEEIDRLAHDGKRLIGFARKQVISSKNELSEDDIGENYNWVGILAFSDPVRPDIKQAFEKTHSAGIKLIVITGDYPQTAVYTMKQIGIEVKDGSVVLGDELAKMTAADLCMKLKKTTGVLLFARTTPDQKLNIVEALKHNGEVVAMTGDGVNDAPALKSSDIGIVVAEASDVARESADLVLMDSSFDTIVAAVEEGRGIFDNIRKIILYLMSDAFEEIIAVVGTLLLGLPLPVTAAQILWINLISDGFPHLALTVDPKNKNIMSYPPRSPKEALVAGWMKQIIIIVSVVGGITALIFFVYFYKSTGDIVLAQSVAFATLGVNSLVYVFSVRTLKEPFWKVNPFENKWLNIAVLGGVSLQIFPFLTDTTRSFLGLTSLSIDIWLMVFAASLLMFFTIEGLKVFFRRTL
jgi:P-type Ca2+ transporter type 2C